MIPPRGALTKDEIDKYSKLTRDEKRHTKLYWAWKGKVGVEYILYKVDPKFDTREYHLDLNWTGPFFDNYWFAYAYAITKKDHTAESQDA